MDIGARLQSAREAVGLSLASLARKTRVQPRIIAAIEHNDLPLLPPRPYGRGFVRAYAREVGLDPDQTVQDYFAQFAPTGEVTAPVDTARHHSPQPWPARPAWLVPAAGMIAVVLVGLALVRGTEPTSTPDAPTVGTAGTKPADVEPALPAAAIGATHEPAEQATGIAIVIVADRDCWITATADGQRVLYELLQPGARRELKAAREIAVRAGNAGALRLTVNGRDQGRLGAEGEVRTARFGAGGLPRE